MQLSRIPNRVLARHDCVRSFTLAPSTLNSFSSLSFKPHHHQRQQRQHNMPKDRFRAKPDNKYTPRNQQALNERADDQIAPRATVYSVDALQRWALATANIAQDGFRDNESHMVERIQSRYANANARSLFQSSSDSRNHHAATTRSDSAAHDTTLKRKRPVSPTGTLSINALYSIDNAKGGVRQPKRRQMDEKGSTTMDASSMDKDDKYAQSSEWSFPSADETKVTKTRT